MISNFLVSVSIQTYYTKVLPNFIVCQVSAKYFFFGESTWLNTLPANWLIFLMTLKVISEGFLCMQTNKLITTVSFVSNCSFVSVYKWAKLVVVSCCHSGSGEIKAEGVLGIVRAFFVSGASSVLVTLWAIEDEATEKFLSRFYRHPVDRERISECPGHEMIEEQRLSQRFPVSSVSYAPVYIGLSNFHTTKADNKI